MPVRSSWARLLLAALALLTVACSEQGATLPSTPQTTAGTTAAGALPDGCPGDAPPPPPPRWRSWPAAGPGRPAPTAAASGACSRSATRARSCGGREGTGWSWRGWRSGVGAPVWRPPRGIETVSLTWLGANGNALAFVTPGRLNLASASLGSIELRELTPFRGPTYQAVAGHPSGQALAFVLQRDGASEVWIASNAGNGEVRLVPRPRPGWGRWPSRPGARPSTTAAGSPTAPAGWRSTRWPSAAASTRRGRATGTSWPSSAAATRPPPSWPWTPAAAAATAGPTCQALTAGRAVPCCPRRPGRPAPSAGSTPAGCWSPRAAARGRSTCGWSTSTAASPSWWPGDRPGGPALARPPAPPGRPRPGRARPGLGRAAEAGRALLPERRHPSRTSGPPKPRNSSAREVSKVGPARRSQLLRAYLVQRTALWEPPASRTATSRATSCSSASSTPRHQPDPLGLLARHRLAQQQVVLAFCHAAEQWPDDGGMVTAESPRRVCPSRILADRPAIEMSARSPTTRPAPTAGPWMAEMIGLEQLMTL